MNYKNIDELDYEILDLLEQNARLSHSEIGKQLHLSRTAVANRIKALEDAGKINGYTTLTNYELHTNFLLTITTTPEDNKSVLKCLQKRALVRSRNAHFRRKQDHCVLFSSQQN